MGFACLLVAYAGGEGDLRSALARSSADARLCNTGEMFSLLSVLGETRASLDPFRFKRAGDGSRLLDDFAEVFLTNSAMSSFVNILRSGGNVAGLALAGVRSCSYAAVTCSCVNSVAGVSAKWFAATVQTMIVLSCPVETKVFLP